MKNTTLILALSVFLFSCTKEDVTNDFLLNAEIDRQLSPEKVAVMGDAELISLSKKKKKILTGIIQKNPGITFTDLYPHNPGNDPDQYRGESCTSQYNSMMSTCNYQFLGNMFVSAIVAAGAGVVGSPVAGAGTAVTLISRDAFNFRVCAQNAVSVRDNCLKNQK